MSPIKLVTTKLASSEAAAELVNALKTAQNIKKEPKSNIASNSVGLLVQLSLSTIGNANVQGTPGGAKDMFRRKRIRSLNPFESEIFCMVHGKK